MSSEMTDAKWGYFFGTFAAISFLGVLLCYFAFYPSYKVWSYEKEGQAELAQATFNRQIKVQEAVAAEEAAKSLAQAEVIRAGGVAKANAIIGDSLKGNEAYLRYLWIHSLGDTRNEVIYVPTEANLPILEASRDYPNKKRAEAEK